MDVEAKAMRPKKMSSGTMTVRVEAKVLAALDIIAAKQRAATGKSTTISEVIWGLVQQTDDEVVRIIDREIASGKQAVNPDNSN